TGATRIVARIMSALSRIVRIAASYSSIITLIDSRSLIARYRPAPAQIRHPIEDAARLDSALEDVRQQLLDVGAHRCWPAAYRDVVEEGLRRQGDRVLLRHADAPDGTARTGDAQRR